MAYRKSDHNHVRSVSLLDEVSLMYYVLQLLDLSRLVALFQDSSNASKSLSDLLMHNCIFYTMYRIVIIPLLLSCYPWEFLIVAGFFWYSTTHSFFSSHHKKLHCLVKIIKMFSVISAVGSKSELNTSEALPYHQNHCKLHESSSQNWGATPWHHNIMF